MSNDLFQFIQLSLAAILLEKQRFRNVETPGNRNFFQRRKDVFPHLHICFTKRFLKHYSTCLQLFTDVFKLLLPGRLPKRHFATADLYRIPAYHFFPDLSYQ